MMKKNMSNISSNGAAVDLIEAASGAHFSGFLSPTSLSAPPSSVSIPVEDDSPKQPFVIGTFLPSLNPNHALPLSFFLMQSLSPFSVVYSLPFDAWFEKIPFWLSHFDFWGFATMGFFCRMNFDSSVLGFLLWWVMMVFFFFLENGIGVSGGTASGKTTVCDMIIQQLHDHRVCLVNQVFFLVSDLNLFGIRPKSERLMVLLVGS